MNLNIDDFGGKSVVPVYCGSCISGTAFFVSPSRLLTAGHVLAEYYYDKEAMVAVIVEGEYKRCHVLFNKAIPDVAVLECEDYQSPQVNVLKLLSCNFKKDVEALVVGYPRELGNGEDYFGVTVKNSREKDYHKGGFDCMVVRTDSFGFNSYDGFSGSPVINNFGMVMGIDTDQLYNTLGYVSVKTLIPSIKKYIDVEIEENEDLYDNTPYGLWTSRNHILSHTCDMLKTRYNSKVHVEDTQNEKAIQSFCGYGFEKERIEIHSLFLSWYIKLADILKKEIDKFQSVSQYHNDGLITETFIDDIHELLYENGRNKTLPPDYYKELWRVFRRMLVWVRNRKLYEDEQFLYVSGTAGCGKSHLLYYLSEKMTMNQNIYMFLGSEFSSLEDPITTIAKIMGWKENKPLEALNSEMQRKGKKATIIIDALNEGAGTHFWIGQLKILKAKILRYPQLKLIVSLRSISKDDQLNDILRDGWTHLEFNGFANREKAIKEYFNKYDINADATFYTKIEEFNNPLFLKMFCETYYSLTQEERNKVLRLPIYKRYLRKRNEEVSYKVDEDPKQNVTSQYISWVALRSLEQYQCEDIPRQLAFRRSQKVCPFRTWGKSLLKNCLDANLLREHATEKGNFVDFEFDSMGDYLKVDSFLHRKCDENDRFRTLLRLFEIMEENYHGNRSDNWQKQYNFIRAFLSVWNPPATIWQKPTFINGELTNILLSCLQYRNVRDEENTLSSSIIEAILQKHSDYIEPQLMLRNLKIYSQELMNSVHGKLSGMTMAERDLFWTTKVNSAFEGADDMEIIESLDPTLPHEIETLLEIETWMLSSSYPYLRAYMIRKIKGLLAKHPDKTNWLIEKFHEVDDPYILEGLYAAIYGVVVNEDKTDFSRAVVEKLYVCHYGDGGKAPQDLMVRYWTLKIFELAAHQDLTIDIWQKAQPPYFITEDIFNKMPDEDYEADEYFGDTYGGKQITRSLFHWDFSRYIIGTNSNNVSKVFFRNGVPVELKHIEQAIAYLIKHHFGWNDDLGKYDAGIPYQTRSENTMERIGKKYQWIGMYRVYAYLCDICKMKINIWSANEHFAPHNYPWYAPNKNYFDPTLTNTDIALQKSHELFNVISPKSTLQIPVKEWLNQESNMSLDFFVKDCEENVWVPLQAYCTIEEADGDNKREQFVFYNGFFVAEINYKELKKWAAEKNFYGRWMPENSGFIDYRWNEFPWADSCKQLENEDNTFQEGGVNMTLAYSAQLQEDYKGIPDEYHFQTTAYMPCEDMMEIMCWHTAERGVIRDDQGTIMAINRRIPGEHLHALLVRREQLNMYLKKKKLLLFWSLVGEKKHGISIPNFSITRLTGAAAYIPGREIDMIQPMRKEPPTDTVVKLQK